MPPVVQAGLEIHNRQRLHRMNMAQWRHLALRSLELLFPGEALELSVYFVGAREMARLNQRHLGHAGATDVITFDYASTPAPEGAQRTGDIFICVEVARDQGRRFKVPTDGELLRYMVHGLLHLLGHRDNTKAARTRMKAAENRALRRLKADWDRRVGDPTQNKGGRTNPAGGNLH